MNVNVGSAGLNDCDVSASMEHHTVSTVGPLGGGARNEREATEGCSPRLLPEATCVNFPTGWRQDKNAAFSADDQNESISSGQGDTLSESFSDMEDRLAGLPSEIPEGHRTLGNVGNGTSGSGGARNLRERSKRYYTL